MGDIADKLNAMAAVKPRILTIDIETAPNVAYTWGMFKQTISLPQLITPGSVICWAAKWHGERKLEFRSDFHDGHETVVARAHALFDEADFIVGWNSKSFDVKHLRREFVLAGLPPTSHRDVDLLSVVRRQFRFASNKLDHVAQELGVGAKVKHTGFELWAECLAGDAKAWALMKRYNIGDTRLTERMYERLLPWIIPHPHQGLYGGPRAGCPRCGSMQIEQHDHARTNVSRFIQWRCLACKGLFRGSHRVEAVHHVAV